MAGAHETAAILAHSVYIIQPSIMSLHAKPHTSCACTFTHHLHFLQNNRGLLCAAVVTQYPLSDPTFSHWPAPLHIPGNNYIQRYKCTHEMHVVYIYIARNRKLTYIVKITYIKQVNFLFLALGWIKHSQCFIPEKYH